MNPIGHPQSSIGNSSESPWPGLESYTESSRQLFFGREKETDELYRLVRRQTLTVLFGQSGLGKSSLIQAGLFPLLRETDHLPLYLRLDHSPVVAGLAEAGQKREEVRSVPGSATPATTATPVTVPTLADQVRTALTAAFAAGQVDAPAFRPDETLWEYFHRKDVDLWSPKNRLLTPVLAFDQFEEIFTLGRADAVSSERSRSFLHELACLVENRPPAAVKDKFDRGELDPAHFNFAKPSCQVILSLREDFLPDLEALKQEMPALIHNRLRLKKLNGTQALEIVSKPAPHLLADGVAERIVEFVAGARGGSLERLAELDVEPPLLSVICRELNERRRALGQAQITADLVSGNRREILTDFYERSVGDLPEGLRAFLEDKLLTKSGFRDNLALETALEEPGVTRPLIDTLVARRLLRIEDRFGVQRVELTHDVLAEVIRASRDERQQRLALARVQAQERLTRRRMWLARTIAAGLLVGLAGVSWTAWRAIRAERAQEQLRREAETRQREEARRWSRSDLTAAARFLDEGRTQAGLAFLVHAAKVDPENPFVASRLLSSLANRSFTRPYAASLQLPPHSLDLWSDPFASHPADHPVFGFTGTDRIFRLVNFDSGEVVKEIPLDPKVTRAFVWGHLVVSTEANVGIDYYDSATGAHRGRLEIPGSWRVGLGSRDGRSLVVNVDRHLQFWEIRTGVRHASVPLAEPVKHLAINPTGTHLGLIPAGSRTALVWTLPQGQKLAEISSSEGDDGGSMHGLMVSHDGRRLAVTRSDGVRLYETETGRAVGPLLRHDGMGSGSPSPVFSADDRLLITCSANRTVHVWNVATGQLAIPALRHGGVPSNPKIVGDGRLLSIRSSDGYTHLWDLTTGLAVVEPMREGEGARLEVAPDGRRVVELAATGLVRRLWAEASSLQPLVVPDRPSFGPTHWVKDRPGVLLAANRERVSFFDVARGRELPGGFTFPEPIQTNRTAGVDGRVLLVRTESGKRQVWTFGGGEPSAVTLEGVPPDFTENLTLNATGTRVTGVRIGDDYTLKVWDAQTGRLAGPPVRASTQLWHTNGNGSLSPDNRLVAAGAYAGEVKVWEVATGRLVHDLKHQRSQVRRAEFSPDGKRIVAVSLGEGGQVWDVASGAAVTAVLRHAGRFGGITPAGFSPDGRMYLTYSQSAGSVCVWDVQTGARVGPQLEHGSNLTTLPIFSPDSRMVLTGAGDGKVRLWDIQSGLLLVEPWVLGGNSNGLRFSPDGRYLLAGASRQPLRIWPVPPIVRGRLPEWLPRLATLQAGMQVDDHGNTIDAAAEPAAWDKLRAEIGALPAGDPLTEWGRWLVAPRDQRAVAPGFGLTLAEAKERGLIAAPVAAAPAEERPVSTDTFR